jgi:hypothetical protein
MEHLRMVLHRSPDNPELTDFWQKVFLGAR